MWRIILAYAPISNGRTERMDKTMKRGIRKIVNETGWSWSRVLVNVLFGYCRRPVRSYISSFELLNRVKPLTLPTDSGTDGDTSDTCCMVHLLAMD